MIDSLGYRRLVAGLKRPPALRWDPLGLARACPVAPAHPLGQDTLARHGCADAEWPTPTCTADAAELLGRMAVPQRCLCLATALRLVVEANEAVPLSDPGGLMLPAICEAFEQRAQAGSSEPHAPFVPMEAVDQVPSAMLRRALIYCLQLLLTDAAPGIVSKLIGQLGRLARQGGVEPFYPIWWASCRRRLAFAAAATAPLQ